LKAKKDVEDESTRIAFENLRSEVIELRYQVEEKEKILNTLASEFLEDHDEFKKYFEEKNDKILKLEDEKKQNTNWWLKLRHMGTKCLR
jgi:hypothetical protein